MDPKELLDLSTGELSTLKMSAELEEKNAKAKLKECGDIVYKIIRELAFRKIGLRIGDKVRVAGKMGGKENPEGVFAGFEGFNCYLPLVRLYKKDGKLSDVSFRCYGYNNLTKIEPAATPTIQGTPTL